MTIKSNNVHNTHNISKDSVSDILKKLESKKDRTVVPNKIVDKFIHEKIGKIPVKEGGALPMNEGFGQVGLFPFGISQEEVKKAFKSFLEENYYEVFEENFPNLRYFPTQFHKRAVALLGPVNRTRPCLKTEKGTERHYVYVGLFFKK